MIRRILALGAALTALAGPAAAQTADDGYVERPRLVLVQADRDWATYYNLASHHSDGERHVDAYALRAPVEDTDQDAAWLHVRFDCKGSTYENLGWFARDGEGVGERLSEPTGSEPVPEDGVFAPYIKAIRLLACYGSTTFDWADSHSVAEALAAAPTEAARAVAQVETPPPVMPQPAGPFGFVGLTAWDEGVFLVPSSVVRDEDGMGGEGQVLYVSGHLQYALEGVVRWSLARERFDCLSGLISTRQRDFYGDDNGLVTTLGEGGLQPNEAVMLWESNLMAYVCLDMEPPGYREVPTREEAVREIVDTFAPPSPETE